MIVRVWDESTCSRIVRSCVVGGADIDDADDAAIVGR